MSTWDDENKTESSMSFDLDEGDVARAAILLALTKNIEAESSCKRMIEDKGWRAVATEVGGRMSELPQKVVRALIGAALNAGIVEKNSREMHALLHAATEAGEGFISRGIVEISVGAKMSIVRNDEWLAVAIFGDCAAHVTAHHDQCGLGVMHI